MKEYEDFFRLAAGLRAIKVDFDYAETRKLLEPEWNGYDIPKGHDIIADDVDLSEANAVTSRHQNSDLHRVVLDLDNGATVKHLRGGRHRLEIKSSGHLPDSLLYGLSKILEDCNLVVKRKSLIILTSNDLALIPSSTPGHYHLILDVNMPWNNICNMLYLLDSYNIIECGYRKASINKGHTTIRVPWVKKGEDPRHSTLGERKGAPGAGLEGIF
jgi:hypothetical protein